MRALIVVLVLMLVLLLGALPCAAKIPEIPRFRIVGPSDGLPSTMVVAIHQDRAGYLWLGTLDGLVRYDGAGFRTWRHDPNDPASLPCNAVQALHIDALDRIWIGCGKTLSVMDAGRRQFRHYRTADYPLLKDGEIYSIAAFDGDIWAGTTSGALVRIDAGGTMSSVDLGAVDGDLDQAMVMNLAADNRQRLWIATSNGLAYYDGKHLRREYVPDEPNRQSAIFGLQWTGDRLWLGSESGLHVMGSNDQWQPLPWGTMFGSGNEFWGAVAAQDGEFWLGSGRGLWRTRGERPPVPAFSGEGPLSRRNVVGLLGAADGGFGFRCMALAWGICLRIGSAVPCSSPPRRPAMPFIAIWHPPHGLVVCGRWIQTVACCALIRARATRFRQDCSRRISRAWSWCRRWRIVCSVSGWAI